MYNSDPSEEQRRIWSERSQFKFSAWRYENAVACLVVMTFPDLQVVYKKFLETKLHLPYISGYLAFREVNPLLNLLNELKSNQPEIYPQVLLIDGNGLLHPRQFGIACHLGVVSDTPTIGVAKNFLMIRGDLDDVNKIKTTCHETLWKRGDRLDLVGETSGILYGTALRTGSKNPVFVSQGHRVSLETAVKIVLAVSPRYRIPEPIRMADLESRAYIRENWKYK
ncbi:unnamed protein product [Rhizopus microsporus]